MNLKSHLLLHIVWTAVACLIITAAYVLYRTDRQTEQEIQATAESVGRQLEVQLLRIENGLEHPARFPDLSLWGETRTSPGICIRFIPADDAPAHGICRGPALPTRQWPTPFERIYRLVFKPEREIISRVIFNGRYYGAIGVASDATTVLAAAWENVVTLLGLSATTVAIVCLLVYSVIGRALRPGRVIVAGLDAMRKGDLDIRLPNFALVEWQRTGTAINALAASQQRLLAERERLALQLMTVQDQERRYLARELHDELGQCLAAINAVATSIAQSAVQHCPMLVAEAESIIRINQHIMETVRRLLVRLRPAEIDELGMENVLSSLIAEWNARKTGKIHCRLVIAGDCDDLPEPLPITLYRIVQECLTNIVKHSTASQVSVRLEKKLDSVILDIEDNGYVDKLPFADNDGIGLLGIRERVGALGGKMKLEIGESGGLAVRVALPVRPLPKIPA